MKHKFLTFNCIKMLSHSSTYLPLETLVQLIFNKYLFTSYCTTIVSDIHSDIYIFPHHFTYLYVNNNKNLTKQVLEVSEMGCSDYIVSLKYPEMFLTALDKATHLATARRSDRMLIFVSIEDNENLLKVLKMKEISFIANVLLIMKAKSENSCEVFNLITHSFVGVAPTETPEYLDSWNSCSGNFSKNVNLFPHDISNMFSKPLKVAAFTYKPYVLLDIDEHISATGRDGIEMRITDEFCRQINCTIQLIRDDEGQWGQIFDNRTGDGVIGSVVEDRADVGVTALYLWYHEYTFLDFSAPYIRTAVTCIAPAPRLLPSWELPLLPFGGWVWLSVFLSFIFASVALMAAQRKSDKALLTTFGMMITQTQPEIGRNWRIRSVTGWMLLTGLLVDNAYGGGLASTYTVPRFEKFTDTVQALIDSPLNWGATHDAWVFSLLLSTDPKIIRLIEKFRVNDAETLRRKSFSRTMAFGIEKLQAGSFAIGDYITNEAAEHYELMLEEFYHEKCVLMARKSSPYTEKFNELVGRLHASGLILAWETQVALKYLDNKVQSEVRLSRLRRDVEIASLHLYNVVGIFIIYGIGCGSSFVVFLAELTIFRRKITTT